MSGKDEGEDKDLTSAAASSVKNAVGRARDRKEKFLKRRGIASTVPKGEINVGPRPTVSVPYANAPLLPYHQRRPTGLLTGPEDSEDDDESNDEWEEHVDVDEKTVLISVSAAAAAAEAAKVEAQRVEREKAAAAGSSSGKGKGEPAPLTAEQREAAEKARVRAAAARARASVHRQYEGHILLLVAVLYGLDRAACDEELQGLGLSAVPADVLEHGGGGTVEGLSRFALWFRMAFRAITMFRPSRPRRPCSTVARARTALTRECGHVLDLAVLAAAMLRAGGARCRIVAPLQPVRPGPPAKRAADGVKRRIGQKVPPAHNPGMYAWLEVWCTAQDAWLPLDFCAGTVDAADTKDVVGNVRAYALDMYHKTPEYTKDAVDQEQKTSARFRIQETEKAIGRIDVLFLAHVVAAERGAFTDVTRRYVGNWNDVQKRRGKGRVLERVLADVSRHPEGDEDHAFRKEAEFFDSIAANDEMPTSIAACHKHPRYILERHLKKYEILHPRKPIVGYIKKEPIFLRSHVKLLHTKDRWIRKMRVVKPTAKPVKHVKSVMARNPDNQIPLFGEWQTTALIVEDCKDGKVPKNERGNIDLWSDDHMPRGAVHVNSRFAAMAARTLGFDFAPAMTGFDLRRGRSVPRIEGIVIAKENASVVIDAARIREKEAYKRAEAFAREEACKRWKNLLKAMAAREKVRKKYGGLIDDDGTYEAREKRKGIKRARDEKRGAETTTGSPNKKPSPDTSGA